MNKDVFLEFYENVVKRLCIRFTQEHSGFMFCDNPHSLYEEYINQKTMLRDLYGKNEVIPDDSQKIEKSSNAHKKLSVLDRHKVCSCMLVAIVKVRLLSSDIGCDDNYKISNASRINEQLAFLSTWELLKGFLSVSKEETYGKEYKLPETYHNISFIDTLTRSLFYANQMNSLSTPIIANVFFLLEKYCELEAQTVERQIEETQTAN